MVGKGDEGDGWIEGKRKVRACLTILSQRQEGELINSLGYNDGWMMEEEGEED